MKAVRTKREVRAELKQIAKMFRKEARQAAKAAQVEKDSDCPVAGAKYAGEADALKYCAEHVEAVVSKMNHTSSESKPSK